MRPILHAGLVATEQRRRDLARHGEILEGAGAGESSKHDRAGFGMAAIGDIGLLIGLGDVMRIGDSPIDEIDAGRKLNQTRHFGGVQQVRMFQEHGVLTNRDFGK